MGELEIALHMVRSYLLHIERTQSGEFHLFDFDFRYPELRRVNLSEVQHELAWKLLTGLSETILVELNAEFNHDDQTAHSADCPYCKPNLCDCDQQADESEAE